MHIYMGVYEWVYVCANYTLVCGPELPLLLKKNLKTVWQHCARRSVVYKIKVAREWVAIEKTQESDRVRQRECRWFSQAQVWVRVRVRQPLTTTRISCVTFNVNMHNYVRVFVCLPLALTRPLVAKTKITQNKRGTTQHTQTCYIFMYYENCLTSWKTTRAATILINSHSANYIQSMYNCTGLQECAFQHKATKYLNECLYVLC